MDVVFASLDTVDDVYERIIPPTPSRLLPYLAALASSGIPHEVEHWEREAWHIIVPEVWAEQAREELAAYEKVNQDWPRPPAWTKTIGTAGPGDVLGAAVVCSGLLLLFIRMGAAGMGNRFYEAGALDTSHVLAGQWWRTITALTLHADVPHVLGNTVCAVVFGTALGQLVGSGAAWLLVLLSGILGNTTEVMVAGPGRIAVGASTATFGALGALGVLQTVRRWNGYEGLRSAFSGTWIPIAAAAAMLGWLGSGPRADIVGHVSGFAWGMLLAILASPLMRRSFSRYWQALAGLISAAVLACAWRLALG